MPKSKRHPARRPQQRPARRPHPKAAATPRSDPAPRSGPRRALEIRSVGLLAMLHRMPRWLVPVLLAVFLVLGLILPPWAGVLLLVIAAFLGWLLALSWPLIDARGRIVRTVIVLALVVVAVMRLTGNF